MSSVRIIGNFPLTTEQNAVVDAVVDRKESIKILAFAGSGKTSTLKAIAEHSASLFVAQAS